MRKINTVISLVLICCLMCISISANDVIEPVFDDYPVDPVVAAEPDEITSNYDSTFASGNHGRAVKIYRKGGLLSNARGNTEIWGNINDAVASLSPYSTVSIKNSYNGYSNSDSSREIDSNRYNQCYAEINCNYATSLTHSASLYFEGKLDFKS